MNALGSAASDLCSLIFSGTAAAFAWGCPDHPPYTEGQIEAIVKLREVLEKMSVEEAGAALLVGLLDLGRRIEQTGG